MGSTGFVRVLPGSLAKRALSLTLVVPLLFRVLARHLPHDPTAKWQGRIEPWGTKKNLIYPPKGVATALPQLDFPDGVTPEKQGSCRYF